MKEQTSEEKQDVIVALVIGILSGGLSMHYFLRPLFVDLLRLQMQWWWYPGMMLLSFGTVLGVLQKNRAMRNQAYGGPR